MNRAMLNKCLYLEIFFPFEEEETRFLDFQ